MADGNLDQGNKSETPTLDGLVGDGKKFKTLEDLAKGKVNADNLIASIQDENKILREELNKLNTETDRKSVLEKLMTDITAKPNDDKPAEKPNDQKEQLTLEDIVRVIEEKDKKRAEEANLQKAYEVLKKRYAEKTEEVLAKKAEALGLSVDYLKDAARKSPQAFLNILNENPSAPSGGSMARGGSATESIMNGNVQNNVRNKAFYDNLKKEMGVLPFVMDQKIQAQLHRDMSALGDAWDKT